MDPLHNVSFKVLLILSLIGITVQSGEWYTYFDEYEGDDDYDDILRLRAYLLNDSLHHKYIRPTHKNYNPLKVKLLFSLHNLGKVSETEQTVDTVVQLRIRYINSKLAWEISKYNVDLMFLSTNEIYIPELSVVNNAAKKPRPLTAENDMMVRVYPEGDIEVVSMNHITSYCNMDITFYPFDYQICEIKIVSSSYLEYVEPDFVISKPNEDGSWIFLDDKVKIGDENDDFAICFSFIMKRRTTYYILTMLLPLLFLSFTNIIVFALPSDCGEKMGTCLTILLAYSFYLSIVTDYLPDTSLHISLLNLYLTILFGLCTCNVIVTVGIIHVHHLPETKRVGKRVAQMTRWLMKSTMRREEIKNVVEEENKGSMPNADKSVSPALHPLNDFPLDIGYDNERETELNASVRSDINTNRSHHLPEPKRVGRRVANMTRWLMKAAAREEINNALNEENKGSILNTNKSVSTPVHSKGDVSLNIGHENENENHPGINSLKVSVRSETVVVYRNNKGKERVKWTHVSRALDKVCLVIFASLNIITTIVFMCILFIGSSMNKKSFK